MGQPIRVPRSKQVKAEALTILVYDDDGDKSQGVWFTPLKTRAL